MGHYSLQPNPCLVTILDHFMLFGAKTSKDETASLNNQSVGKYVLRVLAEAPVIVT
jgi:hypothetical protein